MPGVTATARHGVKVRISADAARAEGFPHHTLDQNEAVLPCARSRSAGSHISSGRATIPRQAIQRSRIGRELAFISLDVVFDIDVDM